MQSMVDVLYIYWADNKKNKKRQEKGNNNLFNVVFLPLLHHAIMNKKLKLIVLKVKSVEKSVEKV